MMNGFVIKKYGRLCTFSRTMIMYLQVADYFYLFTIIVILYMHTPISLFIHHFILTSIWSYMLVVGRIYGKYAKFIWNSKEGADGCPSWGSTSAKRTCCVYSNSWSCIHFCSLLLLLIILHTCRAEFDGYCEDELIKVNFRFCRYNCQISRFFQVVMSLLDYSCTVSYN